MAPPPWRRRSGGQAGRGLLLLLLLLRCCLVGSLFMAGLVIRCLGEHGDFHDERAARVMALTSLDRRGEYFDTQGLIGGTAEDAACCIGLECIGDLSPLDCDTGIGQNPALTGWWAGTSDTGTGLLRYEDVDVATISAVRVWGLTGFYSGGWTSCSDLEMTFDVAAFEDDGTGYPGTMTGETVGVVADQAPLDVDFGSWTLSRFDLPLVATTPSQWLKVASNGNDCWFLWLASSADGDGGTSLLDTNGTWSTDVRDLSYCITP